MSARRSAAAAHSRLPREGPYSPRPLRRVLCLTGLGGQLKDALDGSAAGTMAIASKCTPLLFEFHYVSQKKGGYFIVKVNLTDAPNIFFVYLSSSFPKKLKQKKKVLQHHYLVPDGVQAIISVTTRPVFLPRVPLVLRVSLVLPAFCLRAAWAWKPLRLPLDCGPLTSRVRTAQIPPTRPTGFGAE